MAPSTVILAVSWFRCPGRGDREAIDGLFLAVYGRYRHRLGLSIVEAWHAVMFHLQYRPLDTVGPRRDGNQVTYLSERRARARALDIGTAAHMAVVVASRLCSVAVLLAHRPWVMDQPLSRRASHFLARPPSHQHLRRTNRLRGDRKLRDRSSGSAGISRACSGRFGPLRDRDGPCGHGTSATSSIRLDGTAL